MIRIEPASPVMQRRYCPKQRRHVTNQVQQFVRRKLDGAKFKRSAPRKRSIWASWAQALFERAA